MSGGPNFPSGDSNVFWGEIAPCEHIAQFYADDGVLLDSLTGFIGGGLKADEATIVIATADHLRILEQRLCDSGIDVAAARSRHQYIDMLANEALLKFMVNGWPDDQLFNNFVTETISLARKHNQRVRAFGEMVAILWARGDSAATVRLEFLWQQLCRAQDFSLFCAYPKAGLTDDPSNSLAKICAAHSRIV
ncbi:MAG TPA: MEDS domain-containing protein [Candidatus Sulfotelmatobacter sp.]|nr:MEDS domain-containing protein [Candidatus Sulfotelmatobacter sp.]